MEIEPNTDKTVLDRFDLWAWEFYKSGSEEYYRILFRYTSSDKSFVSDPADVCLKYAGVKSLSFPCFVVLTKDVDTKDAMAVFQINSEDEDVEPIKNKIMLLLG